jgi:predicted neuraminidase
LEREGFVFATSSLGECHASSIAEAGHGLVAAWFGGTAEGHPDVAIWVSSHGPRGWSAPKIVATGQQEHGRRYPCWNPVLFQPAEGSLLLFYKVGPRPRAWWGMVTSSEDGGVTWSKPRRLPDGILGPIKNKPIELPDGSLLSPSSAEHCGWRVHLERSSDLGSTWERIGPINDGRTVAAIQPSILEHPGGRLQLLCRSKQGRIVESWSSDGGATWSAMGATLLPNPNSGTDAVTLADGRHLLVYNHSLQSRSPLNVALSDDGRIWVPALVLESAMGEYSYPAVIQSADGLVHITYTWNLCRIKHVVLDPGQLAKEGRGLGQR